MCGVGRGNEEVVECPGLVVKLETMAGTVVADGLVHLAKKVDSRLPSN